VCHANWKHAEDVRRQFPLARHGAQNVFVFPIGGSRQGIKLAILFSQGIAVISALESDIQTN
jgi:mRNA-degrading endonuclease HigB of HigAB toxin-antitoxin module